MFKMKFVYIAVFGVLVNLVLTENFLREEDEVVFNNLLKHAEKIDRANKPVGEGKSLVDMVNSLIKETSKSISESGTRYVTKQLNEIKNTLDRMENGKLTMGLSQDLLEIQDAIRKFEKRYKEVNSLLTSKATNINDVLETMNRKQSTISDKLDSLVNITKVLSSNQTISNAWHKWCTTTNGKECTLDVIRNTIKEIRSDKRRRLPEDFDNMMKVVTNSLLSMNVTMHSNTVYDAITELLKAMKNVKSYYYTNQDYHFNRTLFDVLDSVFGYKNVSASYGFTRGQNVGWFWDGIASILKSVITPFTDAFREMLKEVFVILLPVFNENFKSIIMVFSTLTEVFVDFLITVVTDLEPLMEKLVELTSKLLRVVGTLLFKLFVVLEKEFYITEAILVFAILNIFLINNNIVALIITILITFIFGMKRQFDSLFLEVLSVPQLERVVVGA